MRAFLCLVALCGVLTGCSTPGKRAKQNPAAFQKLAPADQKLVLHGRVRPGLSQEGVYIAWGEPDEKRTSGDGRDGSATETWVYRQRITLLEPMNSYDFWGPYHGYNGSSAGRPFRPGFSVGGVGYEGSLELQPHVRSMDHLRLAVFNAGKVDRFKTAHHAWIAAAKPVEPPRASPPAPKVHRAVSTPAKSHAHAKVSSRASKKQAGVRRSTKAKHTSKAASRRFSDRDEERAATVPSVR